MRRFFSHPLARALCLIAVLALAAAAAAQGGSGGEGTPSFNIGRYLDSDGWLANLQETSKLYTKGIWLWAGSLVALGCVMSVIFAMVQGSAMGYLDFLTRLVVVIFIFGSVSALTQFNLALWNSLREWSMTEIGRTFDTNAPELERLGADSAILLTALGAPAMLATAGEASAVVATKAAAKEMGGQISRFLNAAVVPILGFIVIAYLILLLSGMLIVFANVILPISTAMLMFGSEVGAKWLGACLGSVMTGLFIVAFMPIAFNAAFSFTVVQPVRTLNENFRSAGDVWDKYKQGQVSPELAQRQQELAALEAQRADMAKGASLFDRNLWDEITHLGRKIDATAELLSAELRNDLTNTWNGVWSLAEATVTGARNMLLRMGLFFLGTLFGLYFIISSTSAISGLIGGVGFSVAHMLARPLSAAGLRSSGSRSAGGGSSLGSAPDATPRLPAPISSGGALATAGAGGVASFTEGPSRGGGRDAATSPTFGSSAQRNSQAVTPPSGPQATSSGIQHGVVGARGSTGTPSSAAGAGSETYATVQAKYMASRNQASATGGTADKDLV